MDVLSLEAYTTTKSLMLEPGTSPESWMSAKASHTWSKWGGCNGVFSSFSWSPVVVQAKNKCHPRVAFCLPQGHIVQIRTSVWWTVGEAQSFEGCGRILRGKALPWRVGRAWHFGLTPDGRKATTATLSGGLFPLRKFLIILVHLVL